METPAKYRNIVEKHVEALYWIRDLLSEMDEIAKPVMGVRDWDDAVILDLDGKKIIASTDGPYKKRLVLKSALIHAATDVVVKGGKPLFALNNVSGREKDVEEMLSALKKQSLEMNIPILGGNTMTGEGEPSCSITVIGEMATKKPIRDSGAKKGDILLVLGEPIWGETDERISKAKTLFKTWYEILNREVRIHAAKDVTKGGLISAVYEISKKSGVEFELRNHLPFSLTRNLDNFLITVSRIDASAIKEICAKNSCPATEAGFLL